MFQAVTDCKLIVFQRKDWLELLQTIVGWETIVHKIISRALLQKVERRSPLVSEDATTRYLKFMEIYPTVGQQNSAFLYCFLFGRDAVFIEPD